MVDISYIILVRGDLVKHTPEIFFREVKLSKGDTKPIFVKFTLSSIYGLEY